MKFYTVLLAIILLISWSTGTEPIKLAVYNVGNLRVPQAGPVSYRTILGLQPIRRCFNSNVLIKCPTTRNYHISKFLPSIAPNRVSVLRYLNPLNISKVRSPEKTDYRRAYDGDLAYVDLKLPGRLTRPLKGQTVKKHVHKDLSIKIKAVETEDENKEGVRISYEMIDDMDALDKERTMPDWMVNNNTYLSEETVSHKNVIPISLIKNNINESFINALDRFERKLYAINFDKFLTLTQASNGDSGMSFVQSAVFLEMVLMALSTEVDIDTKNEIDQIVGLDLSVLDKIKFIKQVITSLPSSSDGLIFRWSSRLVLRSGRQVSKEFSSGTSKALKLRIDHFEGNETTEAIALALNRMIEEDSGGAIRDTFDEDDFTENEEAVLITTLYFRSRWRSAPTLLNGTWIFRDTENAPSRTVRMIRINDVMKYVDLPEWDAEAIEISYLTQGLTLLMVVPRGNSLKPLVEHLASANLTSITKRMHTIRIAATLPLYTLRMTLLLPNKLQAMGVARLVNASREGDSLRISQAVQRIMFWAEAGRNAYKDDGFEWDEAPEMEVVVDRPYVFFVRWHKLTLLNGNFVL